MSQNRTDEGFNRSDGSKPAVGLIATEHNEAELVHTILQAIRRGYEVFVTYAPESDPETIDLARHDDRNR